MKILPIIAFLLGASFSAAQDSAVKAKKEEAVTRDVRFLIAGTRPLPVFEMHGDQRIEVDPEIELIPPTAIELVSGGEEREGAAKTPAKITAPTNMIAPLPALKSVSKIKLKLSRLVFDSAPTQEIECDLGNKIRPLIVISASTDKRAWNAPQVTVIDLGGQVFPSRNAMLVNLSPFPLKVGVDSSNKNVNAGQIAIFPLDPGDAPARYRVDAVGNNGSATVANSAYRVDNNSRLIMVVIPDRHAQGNAPVSLRLLTDSVQMKAAPDPDAPR